MNYEKMSDLQLNQAVTCELFNCHKWSVNESGDFYHCGSDGSAYYEVKVIDYCNNQSNAWPIIMANKIKIFSPNDTNYDSLWMAGLSEFYSFNENPLRAAMIVFLMIREAERG